MRYPMRATGAPYRGPARPIVNVLDEADSGLNVMRDELFGLVLSLSCDACAPLENGAVTIWVEIDFDAISKVTNLLHHAAKSMI